MQFLYADGTDAHFMDDRVLRADRDPGGDRRRGAALDEAQRRGRRAVHRRPAVRPPAPGVGRARGHRDRARACAATPPRAAATSPRRSRPAPTSRCRCSSTSATGCKVETRYAAIHVARVSAARMSRRTDQRRAAVFALYQHDVTGRELDDVLERDASTFTRALAHADATTSRGARRAASRATPRAGRSTGSRRWSARSCASRCSRCCIPDARRRHADPARGRDRRGGRDREALLRRARRRGSSTASWRPPCARCDENRGASA